MESLNELLNNWTEESIEESNPQFKELSKAVGHLMEHNFEALTQILYRLDVDENKFRQALDFPTTHQRSEATARLMIERRLLTLAFRKKFSKK